MAELTTLARPYAKAAFIVAKTDKDLAGWSKALEVAAGVSAHEKVQDLLGSPSLTAEQKSESFCALCGSDLNEKQQNFVHALSQNRRLTLLPEIAELFELYKATHEKSIDVSIESAFEMGSDLEKQLISALSKKLERDVTLSTSVNESLLGGALIRAGDTVIDGSVRGRLAKLAESLEV